MRFRTALTVTMAAVTALGLTACGGSDEDDASITVGIKFDQPGLGLKEGANYTGLDVEVAKYVAKELGYASDKVTFKEAPSAQRETLISSGQVTYVVGTYSITDERKEKVSFAGPYFVAGQSLLVASDETSITGKESLKGKKLCSVTGSTSAAKVKDSLGGDVQLQEFDGYSKCVEALAAGGIDAVTTENTILAGFASQPAFQGKVKLVGEPFSEERYGVGLKKGDTALCGKISTALKKMVSDGTWEKVVEANLGKSGFKPDASINPPTLDACS
ncbi:MAG: glutamate ABC transporter substrate-binding protein [Angustibacter sp.]